MLPKSCDDCRFGDKAKDIKPLETHARQSYACPYESLVRPGMEWTVSIPPPPAYSGPPLTVCPGYTTSLPETIEAARAWRHWDRADVRAFTDGEWPTTALVVGIETFDDAVSRHQKWCMDNPVKKD